MNYIYPAVFYPEGDGKYSVIFPDLNDLATYGDNLADAFAMAQEACGQYLFTSLRDGDVLPAPTPLDAVEKDEDAALVNLICVNLDEYARAYNDKAVKKTLSIPAWLNTACENYGINYSKVLQDALIAKIQARSLIHYSTRTTPVSGCRPLFCLYALITARIVHAPILRRGKGRRLF